MKKKYLISRYSDEEQKELTGILKNKRIELGKNLDEVASGVCSTSYLSRIENNLVRLQEPYLKMLFEKLDINYDKLKESRKNNMFVEIVKKVLLNRGNDYEDEVNKILESNYYLGSERDLIILYDKILKNSFDESIRIIEKLQLLCDYFSNSEMTFFMYLVTLYYYKTNQTNLAYSQIRILINTNIFDPIIEWVAKELAMNIYFSVGMNVEYILIYSNFIKDAPMPYFKDLIIKHRFKMISIESNSNFQNALLDMKEYENNIQSLNSDNQDEYHYQLSLIYFNHQQYKNAINVLLDKNLNSQMVKILAISLVNLEENLENKDILINKLNNYGFSKYDELIKNISYYSTNKLIGNIDNSSRQLVFLKNNVFNYLNNSFDKVIFNFIIKEIIKIDIKCSKYKEACNLMIRLLDGLEKEFLNN